MLTNELTLEPQVFDAKLHGTETVPPGAIYEIPAAA